MTINDVISKYYYTLKAKCHNDDRVISMGRTSEDVLNDVCVTALRKYRKDNIDEQTALVYLQKTLFFELKFQQNRVDTRMTFLDDLTSVDRGIEDE